MSSGPVTLVDITTDVFLAILGVCSVFLVGYLYNSKESSNVSKVLRGVSRNVLLPILIFITFASSSFLTWKRALQMWPLIVIALVIHLPSVLFGSFITRYKVPKWMIESLSFNNHTGYPLLLVQLLYLQRKHVSHPILAWRSMDTVSKITERATVYLLVNLVITELARMALCNLYPAKLGQEVSQKLEEEENSHSNGLINGSAEDGDEEEASETTPLVPGPASKTMVFSLHPSPIIIATILGLFVCMIKPIQRTIVGSGLAEGSYTGTWKSIGLGLSVLGLAFPVVDLLADGAAVRAGEKKPEEEKVPPVLGTILLWILWRYIVITAAVFGIVIGFRHIPSVHIYLQDPVFSFTLVLVTLAPPLTPAFFTPERANVHFHLTYLSLLTSPLLALAFYLYGRGISSSTDFDFIGALKSAAGGGVAGALAMVIQVLSLMPLRTVMNYQYRYGGTIKDTFRSLSADGGFPRYYAGLGAALFQGPLARFGDTAANAGILALLSSVQWPVLIKTIAASLASAIFRMTLTPIDTLKTTQQTRGGKAGLKLLRDRIKENGVQCLWWGALATAAATFVGHYPWFGTYNWLSVNLPPAHTLIQRLARRAFIGFAASIASDTISNSLRVVKTYRQVHEKDVGYFAAAREILANEGFVGLFGRGLPVRLLTNGLQGLLFSLLWNWFTDIISGKT